MEERRHYQRFVVEGIEGTLMFATNVDIINISINGAALRANRRLEIGREYTLKLEFHDKVLSLNGIVVWSMLSGLARGQHDEKVPVYRAGMRFSNVMSDKMSGILDFIEEGGISPQHRLTIRFHVKSPDRASLNGPHGYKVKKVSENGMLIETDLPFEVEAALPMEIFLYDGTTIRFLGRVASCLEITDEVTRHYDIGVQFLEISGEDRARFNEFIKSLRPTQS